MKTHKIMTVTATIVIVLLGLAAHAQTQPGVPAPVPEPSTWLAGALLLVPLGVTALRSMRKK